MKKGWITIVAAILAVVGCSGIRVSQDYDPVTDFASLKTFRWAADTQVGTGDARIDNPLRNSRIRSAVERLLQDKGYVLATEKGPSFLVRYQYDLRRQIESDGTAGGFGFGVGSYGRHGGIGIGTGNNVSEYDEGALVIDMVDPDSEALLWRGTGTQRFMEYADPEKTIEDINALVEKILAQFPPGV